MQDPFTIPQPAPQQPQNSEPFTPPTSTNSTTPNSVYNPTSSTVPTQPDPVNQTSDPAPQLPPKKHHKRFTDTVATIAILIAAPIVAIILTTFVFQSYEVDGPSMQTTLDNHDRLLVLKAPKTWSTITGKPYIPERYDVVIFKKTGIVGFGDSTGGEKQIIKRVIALPGERVLVENGIVTVFNDQFPEGFNPDKDQYWKNGFDETPGNVDVTLSENEIFTMGDNRNNSLDSRVLGPVTSEEIVGKLIMRVYPVSGARWF